MSEYLMRPRSQVIWIALSALLLVAFVLTINKSPTHISKKSSTAADHSKEHLIQPVAKETAGYTASIENVGEKTNSNAVVWIPGDEAQKEQYIRWKAERGWHDMLSSDKGGTSEYRTYSKETLEILGAQGDVRALHALSRLPISTAERLEALKKASVYGSTFALIQTASVMTSAQDPKPTLDDSKRRAIVEALAYAEVVSLRGEPITAEGKMREIEDVYQFSPTVVEREKIQQRAQEIYRDLEDRRIALGLKEFDNSIPPVVEAFYRFNQEN